MCLSFIFALVIDVSVVTLRRADVTAMEVRTVNVASDEQMILLLIFL